MEIYQEPIGDLPLLAHLIKQSGLVSCLDRHYPTHGNWTGPSVGKLVLGWLMYILSENDHCVYKVEDWSARHLVSLRWAFEDEHLSSTAFQDDRLDNLLERFSDGAVWETMLSEHLSHLVRVYDLPTQTARVDSVNMPAYREVRDNGLFQYGHRKEHQANLPFLKTMLVSLDPLGLPITSLCVDGKRSDEPLYQPAIEQAQQILGTGILYVGDTKLCNLENCAYIASTGNFYMGPLSLTQFNAQAVQTAVKYALTDCAAWQDVSRTDPISQQVTVFAKAYELPQRQRSTLEHAWSERLIAVLDPIAQRSQIRSLEQRLKKAQSELLERFIPKKRRLVFRQVHLQEAASFVNKVLIKYKVTDFLTLTWVEAQNQPSKGLKQTDKNGDSHPIYPKITLNQQAIDEFKITAGWRMYATNAPMDRLPTKEVLPYYRQEFLIEQQFHKLLTKTTHFLPIFTKKENRIKALVRLLCLALQITATLQFTARQELAKKKGHLQQIVPGNQGRKVEDPSAEILLKKFQPVAAVWVIIPNQKAVAKIINWEHVHEEILDILKCPIDLYLNYMNAFLDVKELGSS
jgi:transposase